MADGLSLFTSIVMHSVVTTIVCVLKTFYVLQLYRKLSVNTSCSVRFVSAVFELSLVCINLTYCTDITLKYTRNPIGHLSTSIN